MLEETLDLEQTRKPRRWQVQRHDGRTVRATDGKPKQAQAVSTSSRSAAASNSLLSRSARALAGAAGRAGRKRYSRSSARDTCHTRISASDVVAETRKPLADLEASRPESS
jgi:hypothetical protein